jgi:hypothetical protein
VNPGSILEFTYNASSGRYMSEPANSIAVADDLDDKSVDVYPNPASNFFVVYNYVSEGRSLELYDMTGRLLKKQTVVNLATRVEVNNLPGGVYILKVADAKNRVIRTEKIIVQR